jgi:hypothetical protein
MVGFLMLLNQPQLTHGLQESKAGGLVVTSFLGEIFQGKG